MPSIPPGVPAHELTPKQIAAGLWQMDVCQVDERKDEGGIGKVPKMISSTWTHPLNIQRTRS